MVSMVLRAVTVLKITIPFLTECQSVGLIAMAHGHATVRGVECLISTPFSPNVSECVRDMSQTYEISLCCDLFTFDLNQLPVTYLDFEVFHVCLILSHPI